MYSEPELRKLALDAVSRMTYLRDPYEIQFAAEWVVRYLRDGLPVPHHALEHRANNSLRALSFNDVRPEFVCEKESEVPSVYVLIEFPDGSLLSFIPCQVRDMNTCCEATGVLDDGMARGWIEDGGPMTLVRVCRTQG